MTPLDYDCPREGCGAKAGGDCDPLGKGVLAYQSGDYVGFAHPERIALARECNEKESK